MTQPTPDIEREIVEELEKQAEHLRCRLSAREADGYYPYLCEYLRGGAESLEAAITAIRSLPTPEPQPEPQAVAGDCKLIPDYPEADCTDNAHPAWWRGHYHTSSVFCQLVNEILDGKEVSGVAGEPWESTRNRLTTLRDDYAKLRKVADRMDVALIANVRPNGREAECECLACTVRRDYRALCEQEGKSDD